MAITKEKKKQILKELKEKIEKQKIIIFVDFSGLKINDFSSLRKKLKESGNEIKVVKKTLTNISFREKNISLDAKNLPGELALIFGYKDEITPIKISVAFARENLNLKILGAILEGNFLEKEKVQELSLLPTREELLGKLLGTISNPLTNFLDVLGRSTRDFLFVLNEIQKVKK